MAYDTIAKAAARRGLTHLGQAVTFRGCDGDVATVGIIEKAVGFVGGDVPMSDARWQATLLVEDVGAPQRNDTVTDADGTVWVLLEERPETDRWFAEWSVRRR